MKPRCVMQAIENASILIFDVTVEWNKKFIVVYCMCI